MNESATFDKDFWIYFGCFIGIVVLICFLPWVFTSNSLLDFTKTGQIGDTIGGIIGPFVAIAAAGLTFIAFWVQYKANIQQRHDIAVERFESNLFEMIHIQQEIINGLRFEGGDYNHGVSVAGRDVFQFIYEKMAIRIQVHNMDGLFRLKDALNNDEEVKMRLDQIKELWILDHYYRHLYRIFKYIDEANPSIINRYKKYEYASIVRATLSPYELIMIYYNGFSHPNFKRLIEEFHLLNNLRWNLLADFQERKNVCEQFRADNSTLINDKNVSQNYSKSAFMKS